MHTPSIMISIYLNSTKSKSGKILVLLVNSFWPRLVNKGYLFCLCSANILWRRNGDILLIWNSRQCQWQYFKLYIQNTYLRDFCPLGKRLLALLGKQRISLLSFGFICSANILWRSSRKIHSTLNIDTTLSCYQCEYSGGFYIFRIFKNRLSQLAACPH